MRGSYGDITFMPQKRNARNMALVLSGILAAVYAFKSFQAMGQSYPPVAVLQVAGTFEIPANPGFSLAQLHATNSTLYFFGYSSSRADADIVTTDLSGRLMAIIKVPKDVSQVLVDDANNNIRALGKSRLAQSLLDPSGYKPSYRSCTT